MTVDILAIAAHRDDVELTCAGTLLRAIDQGHRTGILDLTAGESGTRGSAALRAEEAEQAAAILGVAERRNAGLPDAGLFNTEETRRIVAGHIRHFTPRVVILPFPVGRHPDHRIASELGRDAAFLAGLARFPAEGAPHRPHKLLYSLAYREDPLKPTFVVDITAQFDRKMQDQQGLGMGLVIAKRLTELNGGQFSIASVPGQDTKVSISFPAPASLQK